MVRRLGSNAVITAHPSGPGPREQPVRVAELLAGWFVLGLVVGVVTQILQGYHLGSWAWIANSGGPWLLAAFAAGAVMRGMALGAVIGVTTLTGANLGYAAAVTWIEHGTSSTSTTVFWIIIGVLGGPVFGAAGTWWRIAPGWRRAVAAGTIGAVFVGEGIRGLWFITPVQHGGWEQIVIGVVLAIWLAQTWRERGTAIATLICLQPLMVLVFAAVDRAR